MEAAFNQSLLFIVTVALASVLLLVILLVAIAHHRRSKKVKRLRNMELFGHFRTGGVAGKQPVRYHLCAACCGRETSDTRISISGLEVGTSENPIAVVSDGSLRLPTESAGSFVFIPVGCATGRRDKLLDNGPIANFTSDDLREDGAELDDRRSSCTSKSIRFYIGSECSF